MCLFRPNRLKILYRDSWPKVAPRYDDHVFNLASNRFVKKEFGALHVDDGRRLHYWFNTSMQFNTSSSSESVSLHLQKSALQSEFNFRGFQFVPTSREGGNPLSRHVWEGAGQQRLYDLIWPETALGFRQFLRAEAISVFTKHPLLEPTTSNYGSQEVLQINAFHNEAWKTLLKNTSSSRSIGVRANRTTNSNIAPSNAPKTLNPPQTENCAFSKSYLDFQSLLGLFRYFTDRRNDVVYASQILGPFCLRFASFLVPFLRERSWERLILGAPYDVVEASNDIANEKLTILLNAAVGASGMSSESGSSPTHHQEHWKNWCMLEDASACLDSLSFETNQWPIFSVLYDLQGSFSKVFWGKAHHFGSQRERERSKRAVTANGSVKTKVGRLQPRLSSNSTGVGIADAFENFRAVHHTHRGVIPGWMPELNKLLSPLHLSLVQRTLLRANLRLSRALNFLKQNRKRDGDGDRRAQW